MNKTAKAVGASAISSGGLWFAAPTKVEAKPDRAEPLIVPGDALLSEAAAAATATKRVESQAEVGKSEFGSPA